MLVLGTPVLNRYDLLPKLIESAESGTLVPDKYLIIDNGCIFNLSMVNEDLHKKLIVMSYGENIGVAASWNKIIDFTFDSGFRIISNDDIILSPDTIERLVNSKGDFIFATSRNDVNAFSLYLIRNSCVEKTGYFDENISPKYAYFEDNDYYHRMSMNMVDIRSIRSDVIHGGSATLRHYDEKTKKMHDDKFKKARTNYVNKWGGVPGSETFSTPYNK